MMQQLKLFSFIMLMALLLAGCGSAAIQPTAVTSAVPAATAAPTLRPTAPPATPTPVPLPDPLEEQNKATVLRIYSDVYGKGDTALLDELFVPDAVHHWPRAAAGAEGQRAVIASYQEGTPGLIATVKHVGADGDLVAVHWHGASKPENVRRGWSVVDLFRLRDGRIVDHWYVDQRIMPNTASGNDMLGDLYVYPAGAPLLSEEQEEANEQLLVESYTTLFNEHKLELIDQRWDPGYLQHNPFVPTGAEALRGLVSRLPASSGVDFFQTLADGDLVWTFGSNRDALGLTDIFRVAGGKIVEHWDIQ